jgi:hypothetical protein
MHTIGVTCRILIACIVIECLSFPVERSCLGLHRSFEFSYERSTFRNNCTISNFNRLLPHYEQLVIA